MIVTAAGWALLKQKGQNDRDAVGRTVSRTDSFRDAFYPLTLPLTVGPGAPKSPPEEALSVCSVVGFLNSVQSAALATIVRAAVFRPVDLNTLGLLRLVRDKFELSKPTKDRESSGDAVTRDDKLRD